MWYVIQMTNWLYHWNDNYWNEWKNEWWNECELTKRKILIYLPFQPRQLKSPQNLPHKSHNLTISQFLLHTHSLLNYLILTIFASLFSYEIPTNTVLIRVPLFACQANVSGVHEDPIESPSADHQVYTTSTVGRKAQDQELDSLGSDNFWYFFCYFWLPFSFSVQQL